jgi:hypothetical protein
LSAAKGLLGHTPEFIRCDYKYAVRILVRNVKDLKVSAVRSLADLSAGVTGCPQVLSLSPKDFLNFPFSNSVSINVRLACVSVKVKTDFHVRSFRSFLKALAPWPAYQILSGCIYVLLEWS